MIHDHVDLQILCGPWPLGLWLLNLGGSFSSSEVHEMMDSRVHLPLGWTVELGLGSTWEVGKFQVSDRQTQLTQESGVKTNKECWY